MECVYGSLALLAGGYLFLTFLIGELVDFGEGLLESLGHAVDGLTTGIENVLHIDLPQFGDHDPTGIQEGQSPFSFRVLMMFAAAFGVGGLAGTLTGLPTLITLLIAAVFGFGGGVAMWLALKYLLKEGYDTAPRSSDYLGLTGSVDVSILEGRQGSVVLQVKLQSKSVPAVSHDGKPIPHGSNVRVVSMEGGTLIVEKI